MDWPRSLALYISEKKIERLIRECIEICEEYDRIMGRNEEKKDEQPVPENLISLWDRPHTRKEPKTEGQIELEQVAEENKKKKEKLLKEQTERNRQVLWSHHLDKPKKK